MTGRRRVTTAQRRARLAVRHHLAPGAPAAGAAEVAADLVGLHSSDPATVYLASAARCPTIDAAAISAALYDERSVVRLLGMRRTVWVVPVDLVEVIHGACTRAIAARERRHLLTQLGQAAENGSISADADPVRLERWLAALEEATLAEITTRGEATGAELSAVVPGLREELSYGDESKKWAGRQALVTRILFLLAADERIVRGRPRGSWTSSQYRWAPMSAWLAEGPPPPLDDHEARVALARRWLAAFGPAAPDDLRWWTGWTIGQTRATLAALPTVEVDLDRGAGLLLADDQGGSGDDPASSGDDPGGSGGSGDPSGRPWAALLPALDPTTMGWTERSWYLGDHGPALFDRSGNAGPTAWVDGRIVGGWAQRANGEVAVRTLEDVGAEATSALDAAAARLAAWLGPVRVTPRFRTPLERELSA